MEDLVSRIVLQDQKELKKEKVNEWLHGQLPDGSDIGYYRSKDYEIFKSRLNPLAHGTVDLILTGKTASTLFVYKSTNDRAFLFGMKDTHNLTGKYGVDILGLNENWFLKRQKDIYLDKLIKEIKQYYKIA